MDACTHKYKNALSQDGQLRKSVLSQHCPGLSALSLTHQVSTFQGLVVFILLLISRHWPHIAWV